VTSANKYQIGDIVEFKKTHPCGDKRWEVLSMGVSYKLKCQGCERIIIIPRNELNKKVKRLLV